MKSYLANVLIAFNEVFSRFSYIILASVVALATFLFAVWLPNIGLLSDILSSSGVPFTSKINFARSLLGGIDTNFSMLSAGYTIAVAILFGINSAMITYVLRKRRVVLGGGSLATGLGGITSGALGIGCAACGSFLLTTALSSFGAVGALTLLPLKGGEFGILSVLLLMISLLVVSKKIAEPLICKPKNYE